MPIRIKILLGCIGLTLMTVTLGLYSRTAEQELGALSVRLYDDAFEAMSYLRAAQNDLLASATLPEAAATARLNEAIANIAVAQERAMSPNGRAATTTLRATLAALASQRGADRTASLDAAEQMFDTAVEIYAGDGYHLRRVVAKVLIDTDRRTWLALGASVLAALVISAALARAILPPVRAALDVAQSIAAGRLDTVIEPRGRSETAALLRALATMQAAIGVSLGQNRTLLAQQAE